MEDDLELDEEVCRAGGAVIKMGRRAHQDSHPEENHHSPPAGELGVNLLHVMPVDNKSPGASYYAPVDHKTQMWRYTTPI
ncbi:hypothetical protein lerEdw1_015409 [Lerista edwardsae]|nr:hypothetical protein lerEdw1_015409 [Lerista edwardsae]